MSKFLRPEYNRMYEVMKVRLAKNLSKCVFIILLFHLAQSFLFSLTMSPIMAGGKNGLSFPTFALSAVSTVFVFFFSFQFLYGILSFFTKVILARKDVMGVFTSGLRDRTRRAHFLSVVFTIILIVSAVIAAVVIFFFKQDITSIVAELFVDGETPNETAQFVNAVGLAIVFCAVFFLCGILISIPFLFSWNILYDDKKISASAAMKKSFYLMMRNYFHFIGFVIYSCFKNVVFIIIFFGINMALSARNSVISSFFSMVLGFFAFTQEYTIVAKAYASIPIYYYSLLSVNGMIEADKKENESSAE
ncbi:hypothetical protein [Treponema sp.]|uniref:hypothetical protein n=1 Tax=Treponema sp. TaxID=166 RepID=UPI00298EAEA5|nr:hypothetical protein [Treponema sp.]MCQ2241800.1 hypothetical protein [Treponema sp.]